MPKSRKRKLTYGQQVKGAVRRARIYTENKAKVLRILEAAMPHRQEYPPTIKHESKTNPKPLQLESPPQKVGSKVTMRDGRRYQVQGDGSWKRLEERGERQKYPTVPPPVYNKSQENARRMKHVRLERAA